MAIKKIDTNKYRIFIELGYDILGNRRRKTVTFCETKSETIKKRQNLNQSTTIQGNLKN